MHRAGTALPGVKNSFYMMNRNIPIALMAVCLLIGSCSKGESSQALPAETQTVTFEAVLPDGVMSRTYGDGLTATCLTYAVYEAGKQSPLMTSRMPGAAEVTFDNRTATLSLRLATGREYDLLFWADAYGDDESSPYDIDFETQTLTVAYSGAMSNDERRDGFYAVVRDLAVEADRPVSRSVMLTRPFAQLNVGTGESDMAAAVADGLRAETLQTWMEVASVNRCLNLMDGTTSDPTTAMFGAQAVPAGTLSVDGNTYVYLSVNYLLAGTDRGSVDCTFGFSDGSKSGNRSFSSVPVQRNYRTNVVGEILTSGTGAVVMSVKACNGAETGR